MSKNKFIILDSARMKENIHSAWNLNPNFRSLYMESKDSEEVYTEVAPYLFGYPNSNLFAEWLYMDGWGKSWGVMFKTKNTFEEVHAHFRKFLTLRNNDGKKAYFRFYDPRVLRTILFTWDIQKLSDFFGPIDCFIIENEDPLFYNEYTVNGGSLEIKKEKVKGYKDFI